MTKTGPRVRRQVNWGVLIIVLAGVIGFGLAIWARQAVNPGPTALEELIGRNAPAENVQTLAAAPDGDLLVGTSLGVLKGKGRNWTRLPGLEADVKGIAAAADGALIIAGRTTGVARYQDGKLQQLLAGETDALADGGQGSRLYALTGGGRHLSASADGGRTWTQLADLGAERTLALAARGDLVAAGGLQGAIQISPDGGKSWESRPAPGGSVTALLFDPSKSGRLWVSAGGAILYSDDGGTTWRRPAKKAADRPLIALAPAPAGEKGVRAITADGLLVTIAE